jgi:hypothetical protein
MCKRGASPECCDRTVLHDGYDLLFTKGGYPVHDASPLAVLYRRSYVLVGLKFGEQISLAKIQTAAVKLKSLR